MKIKQLILSAVAFAILALAPAPARADPLTFTINNPLQTGSVGNILTFNATVTNTGSANAFSVKINGDAPSSFTPGSATLTLDDTLFFDTFDGNTLSVGFDIEADIFTVTIGAGTVPGTYAGSFTLFFNSAASALDQTVTGDFTVIVLGGTAAVPEPASMLLMGTGLAGVVASLRKRRRSKTP